MIKDSGDRTEFETGAKRDMHAGKGRMDLLPWYGIMEVSKHCEEGALKYGEHNVDKGIPLHSLLDSASRHAIAGLLASFGCDSQAGCVLYIQHKIAKTMEADERKCRNEKHV